MGRKSKTDCRDKDCPLYIIGAVHKKGTATCKYGNTKK